MDENPATLNSVIGRREDKGYGLDDIRKINEGTQNARLNEHAKGFDKLERNGASGKLRDLLRIAVVLETTTSTLLKALTNEFNLQKKLKDDPSFAILSNRSKKSEKQEALYEVCEPLQRLERLVDSLPDELVIISHEVRKQIKEKIFNSTELSYLHEPLPYGQFSEDDIEVSVSLRAEFEWVKKQAARIIIHSLLGKDRFEPGFSSMTLGMAKSLLAYVRYLVKKAEQKQTVESPRPATDDEGFIEAGFSRTAEGATAEFRRAAMGGNRKLVIDFKKRLKMLSDKNGLSNLLEDINKEIESGVSARQFEGVQRLVKRKINSLGGNGVVLGPELSEIKERKEEEAKAKAADVEVPKKPGRKGSVGGINAMLKRAKKLKQR